MSLHSPALVVPDIVDLAPEGTRVRSTYGISLEELRNRTGLDVLSD